MLKDFVWNTFENTGNIESYILFKELEEKRDVLKERKIAEEETAIGNM